jgi:hypothetical protein
MKRDTGKKQSGHGAQSALEEMMRRALPHPVPPPAPRPIGAPAAKRRR